MFDSNAALQFLRQRLPGVALLPATHLADVMDSLTFLDFFLHLEESLEDAITLDDVAQCVSVGDLVCLLDGIAAGRA